MGNSKLKAFWNVQNFATCCDVIIFLIIGKWIKLRNNRTTCRTDTKKIKFGEKLHEILVSDDHAEYTYQKKDRYIIFPDFISITNFKKVYKNLKKVPNEFNYSSLNNSNWITKKLILKQKIIFAINWLLNK